MKSHRLVFSSTILLVFLTGTISARNQRPFLSNLAADRHSPLYTTYAAAMERSEFILDEGYHFCFYDPERGIDFITDTAGDWCLAFKRGSDYVYRLKDMFREPVIETSYSDLVTYVYYPFKDIRVNGTFLVYSSRIALQQLVLTNIGDQPVDMKVIPFLHNTYRTFDNVNFRPDKNVVIFNHEELPDGWVLNHKIPYVSDVHNFFLFSQPVDRMTSFRSYKWGPVHIPHTVDLNRKQVFLVR